MPIVAVNTSLGSNIGDMTENGGLAKAFDGVTSATGGNLARGVTEGQGWCGKTFASSKRIYSAVVYGASNDGYLVSSTDTLTITLYGKQGAAPASRTDGTVLGSTSFTNTGATNAKTITPNDNTTFYDHAWVGILQTAGSNKHACLAELEFNEVRPLSGQVVFIA